MPSINAVSGLAILSFTLAAASPAVSTNAQQWNPWTASQSTTTSPKPVDPTTQASWSQWVASTSSSSKPKDVTSKTTYTLEKVTWGDWNTVSSAKPTTTPWTSKGCPQALSTYTESGKVKTRTITDCGNAATSTTKPASNTWYGWNGGNQSGNGNGNGNGNNNGYGNGGYNGNGVTVTSTCGYMTTNSVQSCTTPSASTSSSCSTAWIVGGATPSSTVSCAYSTSTPTPVCAIIGQQISVSCGTTSTCSTVAPAVTTSSCSAGWASWSSTASASSTCYYGASCTTYHLETPPYAATSSCSQTSWCTGVTAMPSPSSTCSTYTVPAQTTCAAVTTTSTITKVVVVTNTASTGYNTWTTANGNGNGNNGNGAAQCTPSVQTVTACVGAPIAQSLSSSCVVAAACTTYHLEVSPYAIQSSCSSTSSCQTYTIPVTGTAPACSTSVITSTCAATGTGVWSSWASPSVTGVKAYTGAAASVNAGFMSHVLVVAGAIIGAGAFLL